ncbi:MULTISPECIES: hypothetical protein [Salinicoccus]|uniref:Uncharacterized protein n=2 Tax=Salinicoccus TaxID=45669 RepID=A0ABV5Z0Y2_9STAP
MAILVKVKDSTNNRTDFDYVGQDSMNQFDKTEYILKEMTSEDDHKYIQFIYPNHTEVFTQFKIDYVKRR